MHVKAGTDAKSLTRCMGCNLRLCKTVFYALAVILTSIHFINRLFLHLGKQALVAL